MHVLFGTLDYVLPPGLVLDAHQVFEEGRPGVLQEVLGFGALVHFVFGQGVYYVGVLFPLLLGPLAIGGGHLETGAALLHLVHVHLHLVLLSRGPEYVGPVRGGEVSLAAHLLLPLTVELYGTDLDLVPLGPARLFLRQPLFLLLVLAGHQVIHHHQ